MFLATNFLIFLSIATSTLCSASYENDLQSLSELVQRRLHYIQHPKNCSSAPKAYCKVPDFCGFGCQVHQIVTCLVVAYVKQRTLVLANGRNLYGNHTWTDVFEPVSNSCTSITEGSEIVMWPANDTVPVMEVPGIYFLKPKAKFLPLAIPADLAPQLKRLHPNPSAWWIAQFIQYIVRFKPSVEKMLLEALQKFQMANLYTVGVQVRRTDKNSEAKPRKLEEYMEKVKQHFEDRYKNCKLCRRARRRIYLATDEPKVIAEARANYSDYELLVNEKGAGSAAPKRRKSEQGLNGVLVDIFLLSQSDYLVCTFSSNVCRLAYVMNMAVNPSTATNVASIDSSFNFAFGVDKEEVVEMPVYEGV